MSSCDRVRFRVLGREREVPAIPKVTAVACVPESNHPPPIQRERCDVRFHVQCRPNQVVRVQRWACLDGGIPSTPPIQQFTGFLRRSPARYDVGTCWFIESLLPAQERAPGVCSCRDPLKAERLRLVPGCLLNRQSARHGTVKFVSQSRPKPTARGPWANCTRSTVLCARVSRLAAPCGVPRTGGDPHQGWGGIRSQIQVGYVSPQVGMCSPALRYGRHAIFSAGSPRQLIVSDGMDVYSGRSTPQRSRRS